MIVMTQIVTDRDDSITKTYHGPNNAGFGFSATMREVRRQRRLVSWLVCPTLPKLYKLPNYSIIIHASDGVHSQLDTRQARRLLRRERGPARISARMLCEMPSLITRDKSMLCKP